LIFYPFLCTKLENKAKNIGLVQNQSKWQLLQLGVISSILVVNSNKFKITFVTIWKIRLID
jgi:hypothetical protein